MADLFSMKNRVVLLTGASRGLGRDMALTLAAAGATVLCAGRTVKELEATARAIARKGGKAHVVPIDITDEAQVREQVEAVVRRHRRIDVLVNNAGIIYREAIVDTPTDTFRKAVETDLIGQFVMVREVGRHMLARKYGRIVNISSVMAILGRASVAGYVAAKHGLVGLSKGVALETAAQGITVNCICPGWTDTVLIQPQIEARAAAHGGDRAAGVRDLLREKQPNLTLLPPERIGDVAVFLCSEAAAGITGVALPVDGGWTAQ